MAQQLPKFIIIQSNFNHRYLHFEKDNPTVADALRFDGDYSYGLETRFEVVRATTGKGLVHIRSLNNNKFLVNSEGHNSWITATAVKPEEDQSSQCCTLFRPVYLDSNSNKIVRLLHVHTSYYVAFFLGPNHGNGCLNLISNSQLTDQRDLLTILDWQSIVVLPNLIRIKGDNGKHLRVDGGRRFMHYNNHVANSPDFEFEVFPSRNGGICLKSIESGKYWRLDDNSWWVFANGCSPTDHHVNTVFIPTRLDDQTVALRSLARNEYCKRVSTGANSNSLAVHMAYVDECSPMVIEEPVLSRTIDNVIYCLTDAKIYDEHVVALANEEVRNKKQQHPDTVKLNLRHTETYTREWSASVSFGLSVKTSLSVGLPTVGELKVETTYEFKTSYQWGGRNEDKLEMGSEYTVTVPPMSSVKVSLMATRASCDIPFSYTQRDVLTNGSIKVYHKNDGLFKGRNAYNYRYESSHHDLE
ncbi:hypothetical protein MKW98_020586 [Papaver atlanticum]|uniref:Agglutinin domain-containing protein n=1 Tax=Papaver atlanticum TaxID=357466 RepID=A0AAD4S2H4_9MAGN|nr:hypothetical protein MKW98_020586 [Papaver atlanticum]